MPQSAVSKNLLVVAPYFHPHKGGVEKHVLKISLILQKKLLLERGSLDIITQRHLSKLPQQEEVRGLPVHRFSFPKIKFIGLVFLWARILSRYFQLIKQADVIHVHDVMIWLLPIKFLFPRKKIILTMHGWEGVYPLPLKNIWLKRLSARLADKVICVGDYISRHYGVRCDEVIYGAVKLEDELSAEEAKQKLELIKNEKLRIVYVGRLARDTGLEMLLEAWESLSEEIQEKLELVFVGNGRLRKTCETAGKVLGWVNEERVESELRSAQICFAGGYLSALEGLAAGCVVIAGVNNQLKQDYWHDWSQSERVLVIDEVEQMKKILSNPQKIFNPAKVIQNKKWAEEKTWDRIADLYWKAYF